MMTRFRLYRSCGFGRAVSVWHASRVDIVGAVMVAAFAFALMFACVGCGAPTEPEPVIRVPITQWISHTYYCRTADGIDYVVPPGYGTCDPGDTTVRVDPPIK